MNAKRRFFSVLWIVALLAVIVCGFQVDEAHSFVQLEYAGMGQDVPADVQAGQRINVTWNLTNTGTEDAVNFRLVPISGVYGGDASYPTFSIPVSGTGSASVNGLLIPFVPVPSMEFLIMDNNGSTLASLGVNLFIGEGGGALPPCTPGLDCLGDPCYAPPLSIDSVDHVNMGNGSAAADANATNATTPPTLEVNGQSSQSMTPSDSGGYVAEGETDAIENTNLITAEGGCNQTAYLEYLYNTNYSAFLGYANSLGLCGGTQELTADPVNTAIGNFIHQETDGIVAGLGGTTIKLTRTYNSQAVLWTPASMRRYYPDGSEEVVAEPPQYFGKGWSSDFGQYLLRIEMGPVFDGVQILYPDGHTANFKAKGGDTFESVSPGNQDVITVEGGDYVLRNTGCDCSLESTRFDSDGRLKEISDRNGNKIVFEYDGDNLAGIQNASGRKVVFSSDGDGRITQAVLPEGVVLTYEYEDDQLSAFTDGRGNRTEYQYDDEGQMTAVITPNGYPKMQNTYDSEFRVSEQIVGENEKYTFEYEDDFTSVTDAYGNTTVYHYDDEKRLVQTDYPDGTSDLYEYNENNNRTWMMDQGGAEWRWTYDDNGNRLTADGPLGWHREWEYNEKDQVTSLTEKMDDNTTRITTFEYDGKGNLIRICKPLGDCATITYDSLGLPVEMVDFAGNRTINGFDKEGDLISVTDAVNAATGFDHDGLGRVVRMKKPLGNPYAYTYDENNNLVAVDGPLGFHIEFGYDGNDNLLSKVDPNGGAIAYAYNASDRLAGVENQLGFDAATYFYGLMNELTGFQDAEGRSWSYDYDAMMRVVNVQGPLNTRFEYAYNPVGRIIDWTDANGIVTHTDYDALYRPVTVTRNYRPGFGENADTNVSTAFAYDLLGNITAMTDPEGFVTRFTYDLQSRRVGKQDAEGYEWEYRYDPMDNLLAEINGRGFTTGFAYTRTYQLQQVTNPEGHERHFQYDANGNLVAARDANGVWSRFDFNGLDRRIRAVRGYSPGGAAGSDVNVTTEFDFDPAGNLISLVNPRGFAASFIYDAAHRRTEVIDFEGGQTRFTFDKVNNTLTVTDAEGNTTTYAYDDLNHLVSVFNAEEETEGYAYDKMGNRTALIEADGTVTRYGFDAIYRLNRVTQNFRQGLGSDNDTNVVTQYAYDARGLLTEILNANSAATAFDYNRVGRMVQETDPLGNVWAYTYDGMGNRTGRTDAKGDLTEYEYYPDDMLAAIRYADGTAVEYAYDPNNNRISMADWLGGTAWDYDRMNRVVEQDDPFERALRYGYDPAGNRTEMVYPDGNVMNYAYSPNNWMASATIPKQLTTTYQRDRVGNILHIENPNSTETDITYDRVYRTLTLVNRQTSGGKKLHTAYDYTYNEVGHVTQAIKEYGWRNPPKIVENYTYDGLHRLIGAVIDPLKNNGDAVVMSYEYDAVGNRMSWATNEDLTTQEPWDAFVRTYAYNAANQLLQVDQDAIKHKDDLLTEYQYDPNGNRINKEVSDRNGPIHGVDYAYDPENRLMEALDYQLTGKNHKNRIDRAVTTLEYDGGGRRLVKHYDPKFNAAKGVDKRVEYVFAGLDPVAEYEMLNGQRENFYRGAKGWIMTMHHFNSGARGQMYWYHYNFKGDVAGLTKHNGNSHHTYRYDPYGSVVPENGNFTDPHNHYTLTGKEYDENTGLIWFGARHYDPEVGVWLTQDEYRGEIQYPMSLMRYAYLYDNPLSYYDSDGRIPIPLITGVAGALVGVGGQLISDAISGEISSLGKYAEAAVGGAVTGALAPIVGPVAAGAIGSATVNLTTQLLDDKPFNTESLVINTGFGALTGLIPGPKVNGITQGNSYLATGKRMITKQGWNNLIKYGWSGFTTKPLNWVNLRGSTIKKVFIGNFVDNSYGGIFDGTIKGLFSPIKLEDGSLYYENGPNECLPDVRIYPGEPGYIDPYQNFA